MAFGGVQDKCGAMTILVASPASMPNIQGMKYLTTLFNQLCGRFTGIDASVFCGKIVQFSLYSGLTSEESDELIQVLMTAVILGRIHGDRLRKVRELCPPLYILIKDVVESDKGVDHGVSFDYFFHQIIGV